MSRNLKQLLQTITDELDEALIAYDDNFHILTMNSAAAKLLKASSGQSVTDVFSAAGIDIMRYIRDRTAKENGKKRFSPQALDCIACYDWPGNMREFKNMIEYVSMISSSDVVGPSDLPFDLLHRTARGTANSPVHLEQARCYLESVCHLGHAVQLLKIYAYSKNNNLRPSREYVMTLLNTRGFDCSVSNLRTLIRHLSDQDLLSIGKTKQGSAITRKGLDFHLYLEAYGSKTKN